MSETKATDWKQGPPPYRDGREVLVRTTYSEWIIAGQCLEPWFFSGNGVSYRYETITHWCEVPK